MKQISMKDKFTTQTCVFDLTTRTLLPKKVKLKDFQIGQLSLEGFSEPVYVQSFDSKSFKLVILCRQGMFEVLSSLSGSACVFRLSGVKRVNFTLQSVALKELCFLELDLLPA